MEFDFDRIKSETNRRKHGISLAEAARLWQEIYLEAPAKTVGEPRWMAIGSIEGKWYTCIYTLRGETIRLISCRRAREKEVQLYHEHCKEENGERVHDDG